MGGTEGERREEGSAAGLDVGLGTLDRILCLLDLNVVLQSIGNAIAERPTLGLDGGEGRNRQQQGGQGNEGSHNI